MSTVTGVETSVLRPLGEVPARSVARRRLGDAVVKGFAWIGASAGIAVMLWIVWDVVRRGASAIDVAFFTQLPPTPDGTGGGLGNAVLGTIVITAVAALIAIPLGFLGGVYLAEFGRGNRPAALVRGIANVNMGIPSIIVGIFVYTILVQPLGHFSGYAGAVALAFIMLPVMARTTEDILNLVPNELRESALALGAPRWRVTLGRRLPRGAQRAVTGTLLAVARVAGETAPLLFTALNSPYWPAAPRAPTSPPRTSR